MSSPIGHTSCQQDEWIYQCDRKASEQSFVLRYPSWTATGRCNLMEREPSYITQPDQENPIQDRPVACLFLDSRSSQQTTKSNHHRTFMKETQGNIFTLCHPCKALGRCLPWGTGIYQINAKSHGSLIVCFPAFGAGKSNKLPNVSKNSSMFRWL